MSQPTVAPSIGQPRQLNRPGAGMTRILRRQITEALGDFRSRVASCQEGGVRGGFGGDMSEGEGAIRPWVLILELATRDGSVEVVEVPREKRGRASEAFMSCARNVLRGRVLPVEAARAGTRMHLPFHVGAL
jgi:hypothetical protein